MRFTKMHGCGNDYVYVNIFDETVREPAQLARDISDRHTGVGSDGLILIGPSGVGDVRMQMYNADGSRAGMCGNGLRCVVKYAVQRGLARGPQVRVETDSGVCDAKYIDSSGRVAIVRVNMGAPRLHPAEIPARFDVDPVVDRPLMVGETQLRVTCVSMGNPHAVFYVDDVAAVDLERLGPQIEHAPQFPQRTNVHFVQVLSPTHVAMRTWERGSGVTRACGSGACAVCVAGVLTGQAQRAVTISLPGGDLELEWAKDGCVCMTGPAEEVFEGEWGRSEEAT